MMDFGKHFYINSKALMVIVLKHTISVTLNCRAKENFPTCVSISQHVSAILGETKCTAHSFLLLPHMTSCVLENNNVFIISIPRFTARLNILRESLLIEAINFGCEKPSKNVQIPSPKGKSTRTSNKSNMLC